MRKRVIIFFVILLSIPVGIGSVWAQNIFEKEVDFDGYSHGDAILQTSDGGYLVGGYKYGSDSADFSNFFPCIFRFDSNGNILWSKFIESTDIGEVISLSQSSDSNFFASGFISGQSQGNAFIMKLQPNGNIIWTRLYDNHSSAPALSSCDSGACILAGTSASTEPFVTKVGSDGSVIWSESIFLDLGQSSTSSMTRLADNNYLIVGGINQSVSEMTLMKIGPSGRMMWEKILSAPQDIFDFSCCKTADGGFAICGVVQISSNNKDIYVARFDSLGSLVWGKEVDEFGFEEGLSIVESENGDLVIACFGNPTGVIIMLVDKEGEVKSLKALTGADTFDADAIIRSSDNGFVFTGSIGHTISNIGGGLILVKIDSLINGCHLENQLFTDNPLGTVQGEGASISSGESINISNIAIGADVQSKEIDLCSLSAVAVSSYPGEFLSLSPNPLVSGSTVTIHRNENFPPEIFELSLCDLHGNIMKKMKVHLSGAKTDISLDVSQCPAGVYIVELRSGNDTKIWPQVKFIKE